MSVKIPSMEELLKAGVHFGHQASRWHPKMARFIFDKRNGVHIIDLEKTVAQLESAVAFVSQTAADGGVVLFLGTKAQIKDSVREAAERCGMPFVTDRWLGGTLTNFSEIYKLIKRYHVLKKEKESGELQRKYTKREQLMFEREMEELEGKIGGIKTLDKEPNVVIVFDVRNESTAIKEAARRGIPLVGLCDTNVNIAPITHVIPGNDDAMKSVEMIADVMAAAVLDGKARRPAVVKAPAAPAASAAATPSV